MIEQASKKKIEQLAITPKVSKSMGETIYKNITIRSFIGEK